MPADITVAIVEDDRATREGLCMLIDGTPGFRCLATFVSVEDALSGLESALPDVLLLDIDLPGLPGSEGVRLLRARFAGLSVVMVTVFAEENRIFESLCNGACGYLLKRTPPARLLESIREAHEGGSPMSPEIARKVVATFQKTAAPERTTLTPHEVRIVKLLADGESYRDVATRLDISVNTVRNYIRSIYDKLQVHTKSEAVSKALRARLF